MSAPERARTWPRPKGLPNGEAGDLKDSQSHTVADETPGAPYRRRAPLSAPAPSHGSRWSHSGLPGLGAVTSLIAVCHSRHLRRLARRVGEPEGGPTLSVRENAQRLSLSRFVAKPDRARSRPALPGKERGRGYPLDFGSDRIRSASLSPGAKDAESQIKVEVKLPRSWSTWSAVGDRPSPARFP